MERTSNCTGRAATTASRPRAPGASLHAAWRRALACVALLAAQAGVNAHDLTYSGNHGSGEFVSRALDLGIEVPEASLRFEAGVYQSRSLSVAIEQYTAGLRWRPLPWLSLNAAARRTDDDPLRFRGGTLGASVRLESLWDSDLMTRVSAGIGRHSYATDTTRPLGVAIVDLFPRQSSTSLRLEQEVPGDFTLSVGGERFTYDSDPTALATVIAVRFNRPNRGPPDPVYVLIGFPERAVNGGLTWTGIENLSIDLYGSDARTVIGQRLRGVTLGASWTLEQVTVGLSLSRSTASEVPTPRTRATLIPASRGTYVELRLGFEF